MNCEHCGTSLNCPTCSANEVARLGSKIDSLKAQAKIVIYVSIPITIAISVFGQGAILEIWQIIKSGGFPEMRRSQISNSIDTGKHFSREVIPANGYLAKSFTVTKAKEQVHLNVDIDYRGNENKSVRLFLLNEEKFENYKRGAPLEGLADSVGIQNLGYNGTLQQGEHYILFLNPTDQEITADIITDLKRNVSDVYEYN